MSAPPPPPQAVSLRAELPRDVRASSAHVLRSRAYAFVLDARGLPIGLQLTGRAFEEETILRLGHAAELSEVPLPEGFR